MAEEEYIAQGGGHTISTHEFLDEFAARLESATKEQPFLHALQGMDFLDFPFQTLLEMLHKIFSPKLAFAIPSDPPDQEHIKPRFDSWLKECKCETPYVLIGKEANLDSNGAQGTMIEILGSLNAAEIIRSGKRIRWSAKQQRLDISAVRVLLPGGAVWPGSGQAFLVGFVASPLEFIEGYGDSLLESTVDLLVNGFRVAFFHDSFRAYKRSLSEFGQLPTEILILRCSSLLGMMAWSRYFLSKAGDKTLPLGTWPISNTPVVLEPIIDNYSNKALDEILAKYVRGLILLTRTDPGVYIPFAERCLGTAMRDPNKVVSEKEVEFHLPVLPALGVSALSRLSVDGGLDISVCQLGKFSKTRTTLGLLFRAASDFASRGLLSSKDISVKSFGDAAEKFLCETDAPDDRNLFDSWQAIGTQVDAMRVDGPKKSHNILPSSFSELVKKVAGQAIILRKEMGNWLKTARKGDQVVINSEWLSAWALYQLLGGEILSAHGICNAPRTESETGRSHTLTYIAHLANFVEFMLSYIAEMPSPESRARDDNKEIPISPRSKGFDLAQMFLISEWAHDLGVPRSIPLLAWLKEMAQPELMLYASARDGGYRQHIFHIQDVTLLGLLMLWSKEHRQEPTWKGMKESSISLLESFSARTRHHDQKILLKNWMLAGLTHDLGYIFRIVPNAAEILANLGTKSVSSMLKELEEAMKGVSERFRKDLDASWPYTERKQLLRHELNGKDHSFVSMVQVRDKLNELFGASKALEEFREALHAIVEHGDTDNDIQTNEHPLTALMLVCDKLQDWGRPRLDANTLADMFVSALRVDRNRQEGHGVFLPRLPVPTCNLYVIADLDDDCNLVFKANSDDKTDITFALEWEEIRPGPFEPLATWIDMCRALQRISVPLDSDLNIVVCMSHIYDSRMSPPHMEILEDLARKQQNRYGTLLDWKRYATNHEKGLMYTCNQVSGTHFWKETLSISMYQVAKDKPLSAPQRKFYKSLREFRDYRS